LTPISLLEKFESKILLVLKKIIQIADGRLTLSRMQSNYSVICKEKKLESR